MFTSDRKKIYLYVTLLADQYVFLFDILGMHECSFCCCAVFTSSIMSSKNDYVFL